MIIDDWSPDRPWRWRQEERQQWRQVWEQLQPAHMNTQTLKRSKWCIRASNQSEYSLLVHTTLCGILTLAWYCSRITWPGNSGSGMAEKRLMITSRVWRPASRSWSLWSVAAMNAMRTRSPRWRTRKSAESQAKCQGGLRHPQTQTEWVHCGGSYQWTHAAVSPEPEPCRSEPGLQSHTELWCDTHTPWRSGAWPSAEPWTGRQTLSELWKQRSRRLCWGLPPRPLDLPQPESDNLRESQHESSFMSFIPNQSEDVLCSFHHVIINLDSLNSLKKNKKTFLPWSRKPLTDSTHRWLQTGRLCRVSASVPVFHWWRWTPSCGPESPGCHSSDLDLTPGPTEWTELLPDPLPLWWRLHRK